MRSVPVTCPWDEHRWRLEIPFEYTHVQALIDPLNDGTPGRPETCPKCGKGFYIHYLKLGQKLIRRQPRRRADARESQATYIRQGDTVASRLDRAAKR